MKRRKHSADIKTKAVLEALKEDQTVAKVASKYDVHPKLLAQYFDKFSNLGNKNSWKMQIWSSTARKRTKILRPI